MDAIEAVNTLANFKMYISGGGVVDRKANEAINMAIRALKSIDSDKTSRPKGHWEIVPQVENPPYICLYSCSKCRHISFGMYNYCPNCGTDMQL